jgi:toxin ParE1/3/4
LRLVWLPRAIANRDAQIDYIATRDPLAAIGQGDRIDTLISQLLDHPEIGRPGRVKSTRELVISGTPFIAVYRYKPRAKRIEVICLLHGSQRYPKD